MFYSQDELLEMKRIENVFGDYLNQSTDFDLVWSKKVGYVWLFLTRNQHNPVDTGSFMKSPADLCKAFLYDIAMNVVCLTESDHMPESADASEQIEIRRRWQKYIHQLPEYTYICEEVLGNA